MSSGQTLLIIDDDQDLANAAALRLQSAGYTIRIAMEAREGLHMAVTTQPDAVLLDMHMPCIDGLTTLAWLRDHGATRDIPVVVFSVDSVMSRRALQLGANGYVKTPYNSERLIEIVSDAIRNSSEREQTINRHGMAGSMLPKRVQHRARKDLCPPPKKFSSDRTKTVESTTK